MKQDVAPVETLQDLCQGQPLQAIADAMSAVDPTAPRTHARLSQMLKKGCNRVSTLRTLAGALQMPTERVLAANEETVRRLKLGQTPPSRPKGPINPRPKGTPRERRA